MTIYGWDMSHYDAPSIGSAVSEGISFITHKAGGDANDAEIGAWWNGVKGLRSKVLLGAYWVLYPGNPTGRADAFLARLDSQCPGWRDGAFILQVDCEKWGGDSGTVPGKADIKAFCDRLVSKTGGKFRPIVYAPKWVYGDSLNGLGYPLWASAYVNGSGGFKALYPGDSSSKWNAYSGAVPAILQYTSSAKIGGQTTCDANAYKGTLAQLTSLVTPKAPAPAAGRKVTHVKIDGNLPVLKQGDNDPLPGTTTNYVKRAQSVLAWIGGYDGKIDGDYGPKMSAAVKSMMKDDAARSSSNGATFGLPEWRRAYGIW
jgi:hypothetical protein